MKLIIAGSRTLNIDVSAAFRLHDIKNVTEVVCGMAKGIDLAGKHFAENDWKEDYPLLTGNEVPVAEFPANWDKHGKSAGHIRNAEMAKYGDALLLIWDGSSRGSANMKQNMEKLGKPVYEVIIKVPKQIDDEL